MNDLKLLMMKHARVMVPLVGLIIALTGLRLFSDALAVEQIYAVGIMLLAVASVVYALYQVLLLTGVGDDRLLLLSPLSRFQLAALNSMVLFAYLLLGYLPALLPVLRNETVEYTRLFLNLAGYVISIFTGIGLMLCIAYVLKRMRHKVSFLLLSWAAFSVLVGGAVALVIARLEPAGISSTWILGAGSSENVVNLYGAVVPVTVLNPNLQGTGTLMFLLANLGLGVIAWGIAGFFSRRKNNFLQLR